MHQGLLNKCRNAYKLVEVIFMKKLKKTTTVEQPNIIKDFYIGGTCVRIADNYFKNKTSEDIEKILKRIAEIGVNSLKRQHQAQTT